jgi:hypothetical protein
MALTILILPKPRFSPMEQSLLALESTLFEASEFVLHLQIASIIPNAKANPFLYEHNFLHNFDLT